MATARYAQDGMMEVVVLFMCEDRRLTAALLVRPADSQRVHAVLEHPAANSQEVGGMGLNVVGPFEGVQNNFSLEFHHGFFERQSPGKGVVAEGRRSGVFLENDREMFGGDDV